MKLQQLHHFAWKCRDADETIEFYTNVLGLPHVHTIAKDHVPSTGAYAPYKHIFFQTHLETLWKHYRDRSTNETLCTRNQKYLHTNEILPGSMKKPGSKVAGKQGTARVGWF